MAPRKHIGVSYWSNSILFPHAMLDSVFGALIYKFTSLDIECNEMALTPSCVGLGTDLVDYNNHVQGFTHVITCVGLDSSCKVVLCRANDSQVGL